MFLNGIMWPNLNLPNFWSYLIFIPKEVLTAVKLKRIGRKIVNFILLLFLQFIGNQRAFSFPDIELKFVQSSNTDSNQLTESACNNPNPYAKVRTSQGLEVHSRPNGGVIGLIPNGWAIIPVRRDATGRWTRITSHFGDFVGTHLRFASAPLFRAGWVVSSSLQNLGLHCEKPVSSLSIHLKANQVGKPLSVQENWLRMGDRIVLNTTQLRKVVGFRQAGEQGERE